MGGQAFTSGPNPLNIVRLPNKRYQILSTYYETLLRKYYTHVLVPPSAPEKPDHGDIDILIVNDIRPDPPERCSKGARNLRREELDRILGAERSVSVSKTWSFAIPLSTDPWSDGSMDDWPQDKKLFFQLDVSTVKLANWQWECMIHSYGDLWRIIGASVTRFGLAIDNTGLHVRIEEIQERSKADSLLRLTADPGAMMSFLGVSFVEYERGFKTLDETFKWATNSRFFKRSFFLKCKEKKEKDKRPMYDAFVSVWLPVHEEIGNGLEYHARKLVLKESLNHFDKRSDYECMLEVHRVKLQKDYVWRRVAEGLMLEGLREQELGRVIVALKTFLKWENGGVKFLREQDRSSEKIPALSMTEVDDVLVPWVMAHWHEAGVLGEKKSQGGGG